MQKLRLLFTFYKSTLTLSFTFALGLAVLGAALGFMAIFGIALMTGGTILSLLYKETVFKNEYVYYQNMGLRKFTVVLFCASVNIFLGFVCIYLNYV